MMKLHNARIWSRISSAALALIALPWTGYSMQNIESNIPSMGSLENLPSIRAANEAALSLSRRHFTLGLRNVYLDDNIRPDEAKLLFSDFKRIENLSFPDADPEMLHVMGLSHAQRGDLNLWLGARMGYLLSRDFNIEANLVTLQKGVRYPTSNPMNRINGLDFQGRDMQLDGFGANVVMSNVGGGVYNYGKEKSELLALRIPGAGTISVTSPRVGILLIGDGLLDSNVPILDKASPQSYASFGFRTEVYFHEARHSDGNGQSLAFYHASCPEGHPYEGLRACDRNLNGPYTVGAHVTIGMINNCGNECTRKDSEVLRMLAADSFDRVIDFTPAPSSSEIRERGRYVTKLTECAQLKEMAIADSEPACRPERIALYKKRIQTIEKNASQIKSIAEDASPEILDQ